MAVRNNMMSLIIRRQKILEAQIERMDDDEEPKDSGKVPGAREMLLKANVSATIPKDHEIAKDDLVKGDSVAKYEQYEVKIEELSDSNIGSLLSSAPSRSKEGDADGDVEMGGMDPTSRPPENVIPRTRRELNEEIIGLVDKGVHELEEFDKIAKKDIEKLKILLEQKRGATVRRQPPV